MAKGLTPWVDVTCSRCGQVALYSGYYYPGIINRIREATKDWKADVLEYNQVCPSCFKELKEEEEE